MTRQHQSWLIVLSLGIVLLLVAGPSLSTISVFFPPLIHDFGWDRAQVSRIASAYILASGVMSPIAGWVLDRVEARWMIASGALIAAGGFFAAAHSHSLLTLVVAYGVLGIGVSAGTFLPATLVAVNWFKNRRGLALGVILCGITAGMTIAPLVVGRLLLHHSWRTAMIWMAIPMIAIAIPAALAVVRNHPPGETGQSATKEEPLMGLELGAALRTRAFWMLAALQFFFSLAFGGVYFHLVPFLIGRGFAAPMAATIFGLQAGFSAIGYLAQGSFSDRLGARRTMFLALGAMFLAICLMLQISTTQIGLVVLVVAFFFWATTAGSGSTIMPLMAAEALGMRCFGTVIGILHLLGSAAMAIAPLITGWIFDNTGSYVRAYELTLVYLLISAMAVMATHPAEGHDAVAESAERIAG